MRYLKMIKNFILKLITVIAAFTLVISMMMFDSENLIIPALCFSVSLCWLLLFSYANMDYIWYWENGEV